jgi:hypothetical protein
MMAGLQDIWPPQDISLKQIRTYSTIGSVPGICLPADPGLIGCVAGADRYLLVFSDMR